MNPVSTIRSVALVIPYFGPLPNYFDLFLRGVSYNSTIDWIILSDVSAPANLPPNIRFVPFSLAEINTHFTKKCATKVNALFPSDICNLRPAFGISFDELLKGYDFWGHSDLDVILGDLRKFLNPIVLDSYDRIYCRGHFSLFRNTEAVNRAFLLETPGVVSASDILANPRNRQFDEWKGIHRIMRFHGLRQFHDEVIADIRPPSRYWITRFEMTELPNFPQQIFYWYKGKTFQAYLHPEGGIFDREVAYIHFQKRRLPTPDSVVLTSDGFGIGPHGFFPYIREPLSLHQFEELNKAKLKPATDIFAELVARTKSKLSSITSSNRN